jgi:hypothetical protein
MWHETHAHYQIMRTLLALTAQLEGFEVEGASRMFRAASNEVRGFTTKALGKF